MTDDHERIALLENAITRLVAYDDGLAQRLVRVTDMLVQADQALAERVAALEQFAASFAPGNQYDDTHVALVAGALLPPGSVVEYVGPPRQRRGLLARALGRK